MNRTVRWRRAIVLSLVTLVPIALGIACVGEDPMVAPPGTNDAASEGAALDAPAVDGVAPPGDGNANTDTSNGPPTNENVVRFATRLGAGSLRSAVAVGADGSGFVTGEFSGTTTIDGANLSSNGGSIDAYVAKFTPAGKLIWTKPYGGAGSERGTAIATIDDGSGDIVLVGSTTNSFDIPVLGGTAVQVNTPQHPVQAVFAVRLGGSDGAPRWATTLGPNYDAGGSPTIAPIELHAVAARGTTLVVSGSYEDRLVYPNASGSDTEAPVGPDGSQFLARLDLSTGHVLTMVAPIASPQPLVVAVAPDGDVIVGGLCNGAFSMGGKNYAASGPAPNGFVVRLDPPLEIARWLVGWPNIGSSGLFSVTSVAADLDRVAVAGQFAGTVDFGKGSVSANSRDAYVLGLKGAIGVTAWAFKFGGSNLDIARGVAVDPWGRVVAVGHYVSTDATLDGAEMPPPIGSNNENAFGVKFDYDGNILWGKALYAKSPPVEGFAKLEAIAAAPSGDFLVGGTFEGTVDVGLPSTVQTGSNGIAIEKHVLGWSP